MVQTSRPDVVDMSVICALCAGPHLARYCQVAAVEVAAVEALEAVKYRPHGTMRQAELERRTGGDAALCPACREVWNIMNADTTL